MRRARIATFIGFGVGGSAIGVWTAHLPVVERELDLPYGLLGTLMVFSGLGAFSALRLTGRFTDSRGSRPVVVAGALIIAVAINILALAPDAWVLGLGWFVLGYGIGTIDISINIHGVAVENGYRRAIFTSFHAMWSVGGVIGAAVGAAGLALGLPRWQTIGLWSFVLVNIAVVLWFTLLRRTSEQSLLRAKYDQPAPEGTTARKEPPVFRQWWLYVAMLAVMSSFSHNAEGAAGSWATLYMANVLGATTAQAPVAFVAFSAAMFVGRLLTDRIVQRLGGGFVVRWGSLAAAGALLIVVLAPNAIIAIIGWTLLGLGLSGVTPQIFRAAAVAGRDPERSGRTMATVVGISYVVQLAGPVLIGLLATWMPLNFALLLPAIMVLVVFLLAGKVRFSPPNAVGNVSVTVVAER
ncbi:MFS transporter [Microbacterium sp. A93]|uniref:MFS transporter n=1 Tax=Microbacterium sp. A93 TaxID=3450716 RepID=UPI003F426F7C